jgi:hypothetical protein
MVEAQHERECPIGLLISWNKSTASQYLTRNLSQANVGNSASLRALRVYCVNLGGAEREALHFTVEMAVSIFTKIQQAMIDTTKRKPIASSTAGKPDQPPANILSGKASDQTSAPAASGEDASPAPSASDGWYVKEKPRRLDDPRGPLTQVTLAWGRPPKLE